MPQSLFIPSPRKIIESRMFAAAITVLLIFAWSYVWYAH